MAQNEAECPVPLIKSPDTAPFYGKKTCSIVGHIGNVKLAIPQNYILGPVAYKGVDIWNAESYKKRPKHPTLDTEIDNFAIKIRLNNFRPIESRKDAEDYDKLGSAAAASQPPENRWIYVEFFTHDVTVTGRTSKNQMLLWLKDDAKRGPYIKSQSTWNLDHYISTQKPITLRNPYKQIGQFEFYYDPKTEDTFAHCENVLRLPLDESQAPHEIFTHCHIDFLLRDLNLEASVDNIYAKDDLARWPEIEQSIRQLVLSFVVQ
ncbi:MAG: hypothetical protein KGI52_05165 [Burkholderiales bacterium]|nr:hypothetical protein [Burkholderiales bacterium]